MFTDKGGALSEAEGRSNLFLVQPKQDKPEPNRKNNIKGNGTQIKSEKSG